MADNNTEETIADPGDDDQWLYGDSNSNLGPGGTSVEEISTKPSELVGVGKDEVIYLPNYIL